jgi:hypothetical protein
MVGGAMGLAILAALATSRTDHQLHSAGARITGPVLHAALTSGFELAFIVAGAFAAAGAVIAVFGLPPIHPRRPAAPHQPAAEPA